MIFKICGVKVEVKFLFVAVLTLLALVDRSGVVLYGFFSCIAHELSHLLAILLLKCKVSSVSFSMFGVSITKRDSLLPYEEIIVLLSGPAVNLIIFLLCFYSKKTSGSIPLVGAVNLVMCVFNLLPVGMLDGGRVLDIICRKCFGNKRGGTAALVVSIAVLIPIFVLGFLFLLRGEKNFTLLATAAFLLVSIIISFCREKDAQNCKVRIKKV